MLPLVTGGEFSWSVADPSTLVAISIRDSPQMEEVFARSLQVHPCSDDRPWSLVVVWDEFTPGNMLHPHNERKAMVVNFTFLELESRSDNVWWTMAVARTTLIKSVQGGWSRMLRDLLRLTLGGPSGMQSAGMAVVVRGQCVPIFARAVCLLSDGDGLKQALEWNGASSTKPCFRHWNCLSKNHSLSQSSDSYVAIDCSSSNKFQLWSEDEWRTSIDVCVQANMEWSRGRCIYAIWKTLASSWASRQPKMAC